MKKLLLICLTLLLGFSGSASAELFKTPAKWTKLPGASDDSSTTYYRLHRVKGDRIKMWWLYDNKTATYTITGKYLSAKRLSEYDCKKGLVSIRWIITFSENMGEGWPVTDDDYEYTDNMAWVGYLPWGRSAREFKFACKTALLHKLKKLDKK